MDVEKRRYPTDLTDTEWAIWEPLIPAEKPGGPPRSVDMREIQRRHLLEDAPPSLASLEERLPLLSAVAAGWHLGAYQRRAYWQGPPPLR